MATTVEYTANKSLGEEHQVPCTKCSGRTAHKVLASVDFDGEEKDGNWWFAWTEKYQIIQCQGCKSLSFRLAKSNSEDIYPVDDQGNCEHAEDVSLYPPRIEGVEGLGDELRYLPPNVARIYEESLMALTNQAPVLVGIGLRALVETVCKDNNANGKDLQAKINSLVTASVLTPVEASVLHKIRTLGNAAVHEVKPHTDLQLRLAMGIVEHLLKAVYILPRQVEGAFK